MYQAYGSPGSRISRVVWMLEELGQPYEIVPAKPQSEAARRLNPSGKVPCLVDGDFLLTDSAAICVYLAEKHPECGMASRDLRERARIDSWMHFIQSELEAPLWNKMKHRFILREEMRCEVGPWCAWEFSNAVRALDRRLEGNAFALGERFTAVDVLIGHCGNWARSGRFEIASAAVNDYLDRILARPARARALRREAESSPR
jgi:glutathione S-transferase